LGKKATAPVLTDSVRKVATTKLEVKEPYYYKSAFKATLLRRVRKQAYIAYKDNGKLTPSRCLTLI
jgi:hypothetical protein